MVMTTSNVTGKIDLAFVDRADMKVFIGLPGVSAVYDILKTAVDELIRSKIILSNESPVSHFFSKFLHLKIFSEVYQCDNKRKWIRTRNEIDQNCKTSSRTQWASVTKDSIHCSRKIYQGKAFAHLVALEHQVHVIFRIRNRFRCQNILMRSNQLFNLNWLTEKICLKKLNCKHCHTFHPVLTAQLL